MVEINDFFDVLKFKVGFFGGFSPLKKKGGGDDLLLRTLVQFFNHLEGD